MKFNSRKSRRHRNPQKNEENKQPFFSKTKNKKVQAKKEDSFFQPKLTIGQPGDKYEQEADTMADAVVNKSDNTPAIQQKQIVETSSFFTEI